jgi:hypothetical protein
MKLMLLLLLVLLLLVLLPLVQPGACTRGYGCNA